LTLEIAQEQSMTVDKPGFDRAMEEQRARAGRRASTSRANYGDVYSEILNAEGNTEFLGTTSEIASPVLAI
jgi:alanyl-tRNA synthetase